MILRVMTKPGVRGTALRAMFSLLASALALLVFAPHTSPLFPEMFGDMDDSALFLLVGKGMAWGKVCYQDLFDHKGPVMFILQAVGYILNARTGVWLLECLTCAVTFMIAWEALALLGARKTVPIVSGALLYLFLLGKGNLTEEFSVPFVMLCLYLAVRWLKSGSAKHPVGYAVVYGASFAALCLMKVTNAATVAFVILWAFVSLIRAKQYRNLSANLAAGILGIAVVAVPISLWFYSQGALDDMLYATFEHNFYYAKINAHASFFSTYVFQLFLMYAPVVYAVYIAWRTYRQDKTKLKLFMVYLAATGLACLVYVNRYMHYFLMFVPVFILAVGIAGIGDSKTRVQLPGAEGFSGFISRLKKQGSTAALVIIMAAYGVASMIALGVAVYEYAFTGEIRSKAAAVAAEVTAIPLDERTAVIGYQIPSSYYLEADIVPCYKYFTFQEWYSLANPRILDDFNRYIRDDQPLWVMTLPDEDNETLLFELDGLYDRVQEGRYLWLYRLRERETVIIRPVELEIERDEYLM